MIEFKQSDLILITGASSGIGRTTALLCNSLGARIVAIGRNLQALQNLQSEAKYPENIFIEVRDISSEMMALPAWVTELKKKYGKFSGFVHCAGYSVTSPFKIFDLETSQQLFNVHYQAGLLLTRGITDRRNYDKKCSVVLLSSTAAVTGAPGLSMYTGVKGAILSVIKSMSIELGAAGVRVNAVSPGIVYTPMVEKYNETLGYSIVDNLKYLLGNILPEDVSNSIVFLLSDASKMISGQNIIIDAGGIT